MVRWYRELPSTTRRIAFRHNRADTRGRTVKGIRRRVINLNAPGVAISLVLTKTMKVHGKLFSAASPEVHRYRGCHQGR